MYLFLLGVLITQFTYITIQWVQLRYKEYLLYAAYIATFILYTVILFQEDIIRVSESSVTYQLIDSFKRPLAFLLYFEYFLFAQYFIDLKNNFPSYYRILQPLKKIIIGFIICEIVLRVIGKEYNGFGNSVYYGFSIFLFIVFIIFIIKLWRSNDRLVKYILWASLSVTVGAFLSNSFVIGYKAGILPELFATYYFIPTCLGAAFEIYFLNTGISYKISLAEKRQIATQQELINKLKENEVLLTAQQNIRDKIAQDLHDDIGATLSGIALHSRLASKQIKENKPEAVVDTLNQIATGAVDMVNQLNDVVWTVNPKNDSVQQMLERLKEYAFSMASAKNISINWEIAGHIEDIKLPMESRRNIYLIFKEAINNAVKYANCSRVSISGTQTGTQLVLILSDNGKGFNPNDQFSGNGLRNMKARANENKMKLEIESEQEKGTMIRISYQITQ